MSLIPANILVVESSHIISEGLSSILSRNRLCSTIFRIKDVAEIEKCLKFNTIGLVVINASQIQNRKQVLINLKQLYPEISWLAIVTNLVDDDILSEFDKLIKIDFSEDDILGSVQDLYKKDTEEKSTNQKGEDLSGREIDVLVQLVKGFSNKEIAVNLNISIHTVISHRKNISQKTGIKSQSGLTIYAISNKIVDIDSF